MARKSAKELLKNTLEEEIIKIQANVYSKLDYYEKNILQDYYNLLKNKYWRIDQECVEEMMKLIPKLKKKYNGKYKL